MIKYLGCSGFYYDHWKERFYPEDLSKKDWLPYYADHFNTVEINNTFYNLPKEKTFENWYGKTPGNFRFTLKGSRYVTHIKRLNDVSDAVEKMYDHASILKGKLGCILWQLPGNQKRDDHKLKKFCNILNSDFKNVIEFRHASWFTEDVYNILKDNNISFCIVSAPGKIPDTVIKTTDTGYIRFHGSSDWYSHNYTTNDLKNWAEKLENLKAKRVYAYFNNDYRAYAIKNCKQLMKYMDVEVHEKTYG